MDEMSFLEFLEETFKFKPIESPLAEAKGTAMALIMSGGRPLLGGVFEISDKLMEVLYPLVYMEVPKRDEAGRIVGVDSQMGKEVMSLPTPRWKMIRVDSLYFLNAEVPQDTTMATDYDAAITHIRGMDAGIEIAAPSSIIGGGTVSPIR